MKKKMEMEIVNSYINFEVKDHPVGALNKDAFRESINFHEDVEPILNWGNPSSCSS